MNQAAAATTFAINQTRDALRVVIAAIGQRASLSLRDALQPALTLLDAPPPRMAPASEEAFAFALNAAAAIATSGERGVVIGRAEHATSEDLYLLRYTAADGRAVEAWWAASALTAAGETAISA